MENPSRQSMDSDELDTSPTTFASYEKDDDIEKRDINDIIAPSRPLPPTKRDFEPIKSRRSSRSRSRGVARTQTAHSLHSVQSAKSHRSYGGEDGYSCFRDEEQGIPVDAEAPLESDEEKRFEVKWDGEDDPMNPRCRSKTRKWAIVLIVAASSLCV
jgi:hypothetical protein